MFKAISSIVLTLQSSLSFLFSGAEVAMNLADSNKLSEDAKKFVNGGTRSLGTCALANHLANAGFSMANGFLVGTFCGWIWGVFTTVFSLLGLWYLGELLPKVTAAKAPEAFLNTHAKKLLAAKSLLSPIVEKIVKEEEKCEVKENEKELVSAARQADEPWSLTLLPLVNDENADSVYKKYNPTKISSLQTIESAMEIIADSCDPNHKFELICANTLESLGYFDARCIIMWFMDHKNQN